MRAHPVFFLALAAATAACSSPPSPSPPPPGPLTINCPADITFTSFDGHPVTVAFPAPVVHGGTPPAGSTCDPLSGAAFPLGQSTVGCKATDSASQTATCTFTVIILAPPTLSATRFVAFGNSLTEGKLSDHTIDALNSYPAKLQGLLLEHYATQQFTVLNRGLGGETTAEGVARLPGVLAQDHAEVLLLEEGVNDLMNSGANATATIVNNLRTMIHQATGRHMTVFVTTLAPAPVFGSADFVEPTNTQIRAMVPAESAFLVDVYAVLSPNPALIGTDGLHPTPAGYQLMAETFLDAIRAHLEISATPLEKRGLLSRPGRRR